MGDQWPTPGSLLRASHWPLLVPVPPTPSRSDNIDAVVVPTYRPASSIEAATSLARALDRPLIALCSDRAQVREVAARLPVGGVAVDMNPPISDASGLDGDVMRDLQTLVPAPARPETYLDRSRKRNIGLLLARLMRWRTVLFVDDDIVGLNSRDVRGAAGRMRSERLAVLGWRALNFPDNSVGAHALHASGYDQDTFIGGGTCLVDCTQLRSFFPAVFNEDWLFFHDHVRDRQVGCAGDVSQVRFDPFDPLRAGREEFGDVVAEGLYGLIHQERSLAPAFFPPFWKRVMQERDEMFDAIERRLWQRHDDGRTLDGRDLLQVMQCVTASRETLAGLQPDQLAEFTAQWRHDLFRWRARLSRLPRTRTIAQALTELGIARFEVVS